MMMEERLQLRGTHGTTGTRASAILQSATFNVSESGYGGRGAYFWSYASEEEYGVQLAESWWAFALSKQHYKDDPDKSCAVLGVEIQNPQNGKLLDATDQYFREALFRMMTDRQKTADDLPDVTALLIEEMEGIHGEHFELVKMHINTPPLVKKRERLYAQMTSKVADAFLVKESGLHLISGIRIMKTKELE